MALDQGLPDLVNGRLPVDGSGVVQPVSDNGGSLTVDGTIASTQSGTWNIGTVTTLTSITNPVAVTQSTSPWVVSGTVAATQSGAWTAGRTWTLASGTDSVASVQSGTWNIGTVTTITNVVHVDDNGGSLTVDNAGTFPVQAAQSGTWNITNISGTVSLPTGAATSALQTQPGVDIGDVTVNNGAGAAAVNIQDGGNSITVDGAVTASIAAAQTLATVTTVGTVTTITNVVHVDDNGGSLTVDNGGTFPVQAAQSGTWTVQPGNTANTTAWKVDGSAVTQPVSNTNLDVALSTRLADTTFTGRINTQGQKAMAASTPVVIASDQSSLPITISSSSKVTYGSAIVNLAVVTGATDVFTIIGSATKTIKISSITVSGSAAAAIIIPVLLIKRSAADTGGTSTTPTVVPYDSGSAAGTAVTRAYTANPAALGAAVGTVFTQKIGLPLTSGSTPVSVTIEFGSSFASPIVLRGVAENLVINLNATAITTGNLNISIEWTEE